MKIDLLSYRFARLNSIYKKEKSIFTIIIERERLLVIWRNMREISLLLIQREEISMKRIQRRVRSNKYLKRSLRWKENVMSRLKTMKRCIKMKHNIEVKEKKLFNSSDLKIILMICLSKY